MKKKSSNLASFLVATLIISTLFTLPVLAYDLSIGNNDSSRALTDTWHNFTIIDTNNSATEAGYLEEFKYYASNLNPFNFVVVDDSDVVEWVSEEIIPVTTGQNVFTPLFPVLVGEDWNVGMYFTLSGTVPFEYAGDPAYYENNNSGIPLIGEVLSYVGNSSRIYSFVAEGTAGEIDLSMTPLEAYNIINDEHTVTANINLHIAGIELLFEVDGANFASGTAVTDSEGLVDFSYVGLNPGEDDIIVCVDQDAEGDCDAGEPQFSVKKYWSDEFVRGGGQIHEVIGKKMKSWNKVSLGGEVFQYGGNFYGEWQVNIHNVRGKSLDKTKFHSDEVLGLNFYPGNSGTCDAAVNTLLTGTFNGEEGFYAILRFGDLEFTNTADTVRVEIYDYEPILSGSNSGAIFDSHGGDFTDESSCVGTARTGLDAGNITISM